MTIKNCTLETLLMKNLLGCVLASVPSPKGFSLKKNSLGSVLSALANQASKKNTTFCEVVNKTERLTNTFILAKFLNPVKGSFFDALHMVN
jgi:hypothetical protein